MQEVVAAANFARLHFSYTQKQLLANATVHPNKLFIQGKFSPSFLYTVQGTKSIIIGTAGHIDHGKTALVKALTASMLTVWKKKNAAVSPSIWGLRIWSSPLPPAKKSVSDY